MSRNHVLIVYEVIAFVFAICVHESAHAWTANKRGDPTARMLGRISLNPIVHVDPIGTILVPLIGILTGIGFIGWAKPTPVNPHNFRHYILDDILTSVAGPVSNLLIASVATIGLMIVGAVAGGTNPETIGWLVPIALLLRAFLYVNILLAAFNLIPIPPLDGSHVLRHLLPDGAQRVYDMIGWFGIILLFWVGGPLIGIFMYPFLKFFGMFVPGI
jgi:Zn-dependent protease